MKFSKYNGKDISDVPRKFLNWCLEMIEDGEFKWMTSEDKKELEKAIEEELALRDRSHITF